MNRATVFTPYPLSQTFRSALEARYGPFEVLTIPDLRRKSIRALVPTLRSVRGTVVLAVETQSSEPARAALHALAGLTRATSIAIEFPGRPPIRTTRVHALGALMRVAVASCEGAAALGPSALTNARLARTPRAAATVDLDRGVLLLNPSPWLGLSAGGSIAHTVGVANALAAEGVRVTVATYGETPGVREDVMVTGLPAPRGYAFPPEVNRYWFGRTASRTTATAGVVYERVSLGSTAGAIVSRRLKVPLVVEYNGSELWAARNWGGTARFEGLAVRAEEATLRHAHLAVTVSQPLAEDLEARGVERARILWHPNGVDPDRFDPARFSASECEDLRRRYGIPRAAVLVTFVGTFGHWHGAEVLARAARLAATDETSRLHFLFVGDGPCAPQVRDLLAPIEATATMAGAVGAEEVPLHLAASDVLASPHVPNPDGSAFFGSPTKLFEYMAAAKAIVASDLGQISDVLAGGAGILARPGDEHDLLRGLNEVAADPARRDELGRRARERVMERYTWRAQVRAILAAMERIR